MRPYMYVIGTLPRATSGKIDVKSLVVPKLQPSSSTLSIAAPSNRTETDLLQLFCSVLHLEGRENAVGVDSGFFELGGNSLLAARLLTRVQNHFGVTLPIATLFSSPTVRLLAKDIFQHRAGTPTKASHNSPLLVIQEGTKTPIFCLHPAGGNAMCFYPLAAELPGYPIYALEDMNSGEEETYSYSNIFDMAKGKSYMAFSLWVLLLLIFC